MSRSGTLLYRCRRCGRLDHNPGVPDALLASELLAAGAPFPGSWGPLTAGALAAHVCGPGRTGLADLIGATDGPPPADPTPAGPADRTHYDPREVPPRYPLELTSGGHVCLWDADGRFKWTVARWVAHKEGYDLQFLGDRPFDPRVDWSDFGEVARQGQALADEVFGRDRADDGDGTA